MNKKKNTYILAIIVAYLTNCIGVLVSLLGRCLSPLDTRLQRFFSPRKIEAPNLFAIESARAHKSFCVIFFCSSAGEYEQALPVAQRLIENKNIYVHFFFFSTSGSNFAKLRHETIPFSLAPIDTFKNWQKLLRVLNPDLTIIVRHELWPCFLYSVKKFGPTFLINASLKTHKNLFFKKILFEFIDKIFTVSEQETLNFKDHFSRLRSKFKTVGDSKYDRVLERVSLIKNKNNYVPFSNSRQKLRLIVGSGWEQDCDLALKSLVVYKAKQQRSLQIILAPHQPTASFITLLKQECERYQLSWTILKNLKEQEAADIIIVDKIGILFELYGECDLAFVGGGMHHQVHNVLEPAAFGLPLAFGPLYYNSHEACDLVTGQLATVVHNPDEFIGWMKLALARGSKDLNLQSFIEAKAGASPRLLAEIEACKAQAQKKER